MTEIKRYSEKVNQPLLHGHLNPEGTGTRDLHSQVDSYLLPADDFTARSV